MKRKERFDDIRLRLLEPWDGYREPLFECPICHERKRGASISHSSFACKWLGAKIKVVLFGKEYEVEITETTTGGMAYPYFSFEIESPEGLVCRIAIDPDEYPVQVISRPLAHGYEKRSQPNQYTYY